MAKPHNDRLTIIKVFVDQRLIILYSISMTTLQARFINQIQTIPADDWNRITGTAYPFIRHEFLAAMEESGSVCPETGWTPSHLTLRDQSEKLIGAMPCYAKENSYGEYVFDWSWANAYHQHGIPYYPKLLTAIPFTPCVGPRLAVHPCYDNLATVQFVLDAILKECERQHYSSWHLLFPNADLISLLDAHNTAALPTTQGPIMQRMGSQFHWYNRGYETFDDYLDAMTSRKRKSIRREREKVAAQGITFLHVNGQEISEQLLDEFYVFYHATYMKRGQHGYLNRDCFDLFVRDMPENLHFVFARKSFTKEELDKRRYFWRGEDGEVAMPGEEESIAAALFLLGDDTIYGRYWGCLDEFDHLHFETCYYQGIDYCIQQKLTHFDAGAQGEHKIQRGFEPISTYSYHWIAHRGFQDAIQSYLALEQKDVAEYIKDATTYLPFKQS